MNIGRSFFSLLLVALLFVNSTKASFIYAYYNLDPIGFIEALCENKDQPELACHGKCQLMRVAESQDKKQQTPESIIDFKQLVFYPNPAREFVFLNLVLNEKQQPTTYLNLYAFRSSKDCFHPPRV